MEAVRTCLGCRQRAPRSSLLRIVARDGRATVDAAARLPGRGAWVHPDPGCIDAAVKRKAFGRALRTAITTESLPDMSDLQKWTDRHMDN
ncbi:YlxR family protein [Pseudolysinimonas sp.]|uniref:YlxR family protein n=1 Tax=Pseudolysinimonas sp. TaxID=2680009 RepID=UPI00286CEDD6|nr:YlxR family protein [Pseudolysinimonas sp.]